MSKIIDAVSIVMTCKDEIFAIQRQPFLRAFPGYWAFPGGKVDPGDESFYETHAITEQLDQRLFGTAVREAQEELGIDLREEIKAGRVERVDFFGLAVTPDFNPYRYATYFFRFHFKEKVPFVVDRNEAKVSEWIRAAELLKRYDNGQILAVPPVIKVIEGLGKNPDIRTISDLNFDYDSTQFVPYIESLRSILQLMPLSHTLPPASRTNSFLIGDEGSPRIILDPSPKDEEEYRKFKNTLKLFGADQIMLTHHHPDHHERATTLAREYNIPILLSQDTYERLTRIDSTYFESIKLVFLKDGDIVTRWLKRDVVVHAIPGHDEGHLALAPTDMSWFIAGDLFQGVGSVVIGGDEGDMSKYFKSLEKIIVMNPKVVYPSHGIGLGGVNIIETTLEHRRVRENQVLTLHKQGLSVDEILKEIYIGVPHKLWPYALQNIQKHLEKLKVDGKIS